MNRPYTNIEGRVYSDETSGVELPRLGSTNTFTGGNTFAGMVATSLTASGTVSGPNIQTTATAATATADGSTTGNLTTLGTYSFVSVTSANAAHIITLPASTPGRVVRLYVGANGYELKSSIPSSIAINGGIGASVSSTVGANVLVIAQCTSATTWVANTYSSTGTVAALEAAH
jgi:hypothetical protein